ncbi:MAG: DUF1295 domain-containing protein [Xanthobacteraceae bacterium]|nr:DUF1295 domain-containing protein [Xanthobacteraceae bacterium]
MTVFYLKALGAIALSLSVFMAFAWAVQQRTGNSGWVDTIWTYAVGLIGAWSAMFPAVFHPSIDDTFTHRQWLVAALVALWSLRLGGYIAERTAESEKTDDPRYAAMAAEWGKDAPRQMFIFLQQQAIGSVPLVFAVFIAAHNPAPGLRAQDYIGALILLIAIAGETIADGQLRAFRSNPANKGKVCDVGLWKYSRHPNYFFEWFGWLAYPVIAISAGYWWGWLTLLAPLIMYFILVFITGVPPLEQQMLQSRGDAFRAYQGRTSKFFLLPPFIWRAISKGAA